jgi:hypothetical protein
MATHAEDKTDLAWGCEAIADEIERSPRQTFHMLTNGELPAKKVGGRWVASRKKLREFFEEISA